MSIVKKSILRIRFDLQSPLIIGSGKNENTDNDLVLNGNGDPYIPGTAVAGVIRSMIANTGICESELNKYFGYVATDPDKAKKQPAISSPVMFYDANIELPRDSNNRKTYHISRRDFVALDEWKTAIKGAKFDMEILEPGVSLVTYVEQNSKDVDDRDMLSEIADCWKSGKVRFGAKTMRGFGDIAITEIKRVDFDMENPVEVRDWLGSNMYEEEYWKTTDPLDLSYAEAANSRDIVLDLKLKLKTAISVRKYTTEPRGGNDESPQPDYSQLTSHGKGGAEDPVIPGTTWAGAFRSNMRRLVKDLNEDFFGSVNEKTGEKTRSKIMFSESRISGGKDKILTRNAIDRFSGGTVNGALYTEKTHYGGQTDLRITICEGSPSKDLLRAFAAAVADLHAGILSVGGLTSVGRGLFEVEEINGEEAPMDPAAVFDTVLSLLEKQLPKD